MDKNHHWKILRYVLRSKNPRLYMHLAKQVVGKLNSHNWKEESIKNLIFIFNTVVQLENYLYARFDLVQDLLKDIVNKKEQLSQADVLKVMEGAAVMQ